MSLCCAVFAFPLSDGEDFGCVGACLAWTQGVRSRMYDVFGKNRLYCGGFNNQDVVHLMHGHGSVKGE
jgi:hypothetical protein